MTQRRYFGTDGVRGPVDGPTVNPAFFEALAGAVGLWMRTARGTPPGSRIIVGRDTRGSGEELERAVALGFARAGFAPQRGGIAPTPAIAGAIRAGDAVGGAAITASHNPASDNGVKFFDAAGFKLSDEDEARVEMLLQAPLPVTRIDAAPPVDLVAEHAARVGTLLPQGALQGWTLAVDCAHGATTRVTPQVLERLGARVLTLGCSPDGTNINAGCGSEHPETLCALVRAEHAAVGIAHDGDGDRVVVVDETGSVVHGDELLAILALDLLRAGRLHDRVLVATVQSNLGLDAALAREGGRVERTPVGDRYVAEALRAGAWSLGGENSGHIIQPDVSWSGDGLVAALLLLDVLRRTGRPLSELRGQMRLFPQTTAAVRVRAKPALETVPVLREAIAAAEAEVRGRGRVLVRYSGTEPKLRLLVESDSAEANAGLIARLRHVVERELG